MLLVTFCRKRGPRQECPKLENIGWIFQTIRAFSTFPPVVLSVNSLALAASVHPSGDIPTLRPPSFPLSMFPSVAVPFLICLSVCLSVCLLRRVKVDFFISPVIAVVCPVSLLHRDLLSGHQPADRADAGSGAEDARAWGRGVLPRLGTARYDDGEPGSSWRIPARYADSGQQLRQPASLCCHSPPKPFPLKLRRLILLSLLVLVVVLLVVVVLLHLCLLPFAAGNIFLFDSASWNFVIV